MPKNGNQPTPASPDVATAPPGQMLAAGRLTVAQVLPTTVFPMIGSLLYIVGGMPVPDVFTLLAGCGAIGAAATIFVTGGRRLAMALAHGVIAAANSK
ncbi:hypothetical protein ACQF36_29880 [Streptomyces sp. Marseille-Q5077]|uniref:hypothetical protein n=1 Tax=Streptomyces sp. Marseille-Q5077 TaxID=3418995 RepID=UPI003D077CE1